MSFIMSISSTHTWQKPYLIVLLIKFASCVTGFNTISQLISQCNVIDVDHYCCQDLEWKVSRLETFHKVL